MTAFASLEDKLRSMLEREGAIPLATYMQLCMADPQFGYYTTRKTIGRQGDFITAPEISQMFGELLGVWCITAWQAIGRPRSFCLAEPGPGHGTMMADILRAMASVQGMLQSAHLHLVETSPVMREAQHVAIAPWQSRLGNCTWIEGISELPDLPLILVANEFLDALPFRQYVKTPRGWQEVGVGILEDGSPGRVLLPALANPQILPAGAAGEPEGTVFEHAPAREAFTEAVSGHLTSQGGAALLVDYGHVVSAFGDTFQAMKGHAFGDPFTDPGNQDLTSHVDFGRLATAARAAGIPAPKLATQGDFLLALGLLERAGALGSNADNTTRERLRSQVERLAGPGQMGRLFKVLQLASPDLDLPGFTHAPEIGSA